jgi:hypothetical protein
MTETDQQISQPAANGLDERTPAADDSAVSSPSQAPAGASPAEVTQHYASEKERLEALEVVKKEIADAKAIEARDRDDAEAGTKTLRTALGTEFAPAMRILWGYLNRMTPDQREELLREELPDGRLAANDPATLIRVLDKLVADKATGRSREEELEQLRNYMRTNRKKWNRDEIAQFRYRMLLRQG